LSLNALKVLKHVRHGKSLKQEGLPARNALVESFAVHTRQLIELLTGADDRDLRAAHFTRDPWEAPDPNAVNEMDELWTRFSRQVVHLSRDRASYSQEERRVLTREVWELIVPHLRRFVDAVDRDRVCEGFCEEATEALIEPMPRSPLELPRGNISVGPVEHTAGTATQGLRQNIHIEPPS
jgi:hypothetical protein